MKIIVSGGGTAGHIYPALAVADELRDRGHEILFVGSLGKMEMEIVPKNGYRIIGLPVVGIQRKLNLRGICSNFIFPFKLLRSMSLAKRIIASEKPDVVVGFGGYASAPIVKAAQKANVPTVLQEQNSYAGLTNRLLAKRAVAICTAYEGMERFFDPSKITITGNPLRGNIHSMPDRAQGIAQFDLDQTKQTILVTGGSLGTRTLNEMVFLNPIPDNVQVIWQTGKFYISQYEEKIRQTGFNIERHKIMPFIQRMDYAYAAADVVVCRAGASTVSELQLIGKPVLFIPSPHVAEDHQTANAMALVKANAAIMVTDEHAVEFGIQKAVELLSNAKLREQMSLNIKAMSRPNAVGDVADIIIRASKK